MPNTSIPAAIFTCLATWSISSSSAAESIFIFAGQSNMTGTQAKAGQLSADQRGTDPAILAFYAKAEPSGENFNPFAPEVSPWKPSTGAWATYDPFTSTQPWYTGFNPGDCWSGMEQFHCFGPELAATRVIQSSIGGKSCIIKYSVGGSNMVYNWGPVGTRDGRPTGTHFSAMLEWTRKGLAERPGAKVAGFFWLQGEADCGDSSSRLYEANLVNFIARLRGELKDEGLPVVIAKVHPGAEGKLYGPADGIARVREAQERTGKAIPRVAVVDTQDLSLALDERNKQGELVTPIHLDTASMITLGKRMGEAWLKIKDAPAPAQSSGGDRVAMIAWEPGADVGQWYVSGGMQWASGGKANGQSFWRYTGTPREDDAQPWMNAAFKAPQNWMQGSSISLLVRGDGSTQYWICELMDGKPAERFVHEFTVSGDAWKEIVLPFAGFQRRGHQDKDAPADGFGLGAITGIGLIGTPKSKPTLDIARIAVLR